MQSPVMILIRASLCSFALILIISSSFAASISEQNQNHARQINSIEAYLPRSSKSTKNQSGPSDEYSLGDDEDVSKLEQITPAKGRNLHYNAPYQYNSFSSQSQPQPQLKQNPAQYGYSNQAYAYGGTYQQQQQPSYGGYNKGSTQLVNYYSPNYQQRPTINPHAKYEVIELEKPEVKIYKEEKKNKAHDKSSGKSKPFKTVISFNEASKFYEPVDYYELYEPEVVYVKEKNKKKKHPIKKDPIKHIKKVKEKVVDKILDHKEEKIDGLNEKILSLFGDLVSHKLKEKTLVEGLSDNAKDKLDQVIEHKLKAKDIVVGLTGKAGDKVSKGLEHKQVPSIGELHGDVGDKLDEVKDFKLKENELVEGLGDDAKGHLDKVFEHKLKEKELIDSAIGTILNKKRGNENKKEDPKNGKAKHQDSHTFKELEDLAEQNGHNNKNKGKALESHVHKAPANKPIEHKEAPIADQHGDEFDPEEEEMEDDNEDINIDAELEKKTQLLKQPDQKATKDPARAAKQEAVKSPEVKKESPASTKNNNNHDNNKNSEEKHKAPSESNHSRSQHKTVNPPINEPSTNKPAKVVDPSGDKKKEDGFNLSNLFEPVDKIAIQTFGPKGSRSNFEITMPPMPSMPKDLVDTAGKIMNAPGNMLKGMVKAITGSFDPMRDMAGKVKEELDSLQRQMNEPGADKELTERRRIEAPIAKG